jgi:hypothetical protein
MARKNWPCLTFVFSPTHCMCKGWQVALPAELTLARLGFWDAPHVAECAPWSFVSCKLFWYRAICQCENTYTGLSPSPDTPTVSATHLSLPKKVHLRYTSISGRQFLKSIMRLRSVIAALFTLTLSIVSTIFVLLALTSRRWAVQKYYADADNPVNWIDPICLANRSPFLRCGYPNVTAANATSNASCSVPDCDFYKPYGWDQTSCRLAAEVASVDGASAQDLVGTAQECQQGKRELPLVLPAKLLLTTVLSPLHWKSSDRCIGLHHSWTPHQYRTGFHHICERCFHVFAKRGGFGSDFKRHRSCGH